MSYVFIAWAQNREMQLSRIVLGPNVEEAAEIRSLAERLNVPLIEGQTTPRPNDLWAGISPEGGWQDLEDRAMWARSAEGSVVVSRLQFALVVDKPWGIEFRSGNFLQTIKADMGGPAKTAMKFGTKSATENFMREHDWVYINGGMAKQIEPTV